MNTPNENGNAVEQVKALRAAFMAGAEWQHDCIYYRCPSMGTPAGAAALRYPMPTVEVPRVLSESGFDLNYKIDVRTDGLRVLFVKSGTITGGVWKDITSAPHTIDLSRLALIADLYANPNERRPADEVTP